MTLARVEFSSRYAALFASRAPVRCLGSFLAMILLVVCGTASVFAQEEWTIVRAMIPASDAPLFRLPFT